MYKAAHKHLSEFGIRPSIQRLAVLDYLMKNRTHPTADDILSALRPCVPGLSRATVYNTVSLLAENGAISALDLNDGRIHYDGDTSPHAHFICTRCGAIHDIFPEAEDWRHMLAAAPPPPGASVADTQLSYRGICAKCNKQHNDN